MLKFAMLACAGIVTQEWMTKHAVKFSWLPRNSFFPLLT